MENVAIITKVEFCGCTNEQLEEGKTCGQDNCPNKAAADEEAFLRTIRPREDEEAGL